ncbi:MAG TPA: hypothetical protein VMR70_13095 [Flavisolibacter sp.]|nr:hypothetical protein [Flavisolibacter sp.]
MRKANSTYRVLTGLTLVFMLIAALSFAAFHNAEDLCNEAKNCIQPLPSKKGSDILWDGFSRGFIALITLK